MLENSVRRSGAILILILRLVIHILSHSVITISRIVMVPGHAVSSLRLVELTQPRLIPLADSVGRCIMDFVRREETSSLSVVNWATCIRAVL